MANAVSKYTNKVVSHIEFIQMNSLSLTLQRSAR